MTYALAAKERPTRLEASGPCDVPTAAGSTGLDFTCPFLPEALARTAGLGFLSSDERLRLNQIRGNAVLVLLPLIDGLAEGREPAELARPHPRLRGLREAFAAGFGASCPVIDPEAAAARLGEASRLSRALLGLHRLWMARRHVQAAALNARTLEPAFRRFFLDRWLDTAAHGPAPAWPGPHAADVMAKAVAGYRRLCHGLAETLHEQAHLDLAALEAACGRRLHAHTREEALRVQREAYWWTYVGCGQSDPRSARTGQGRPHGQAAETDPLIAAFG
jgi:hypothetical protein